MIRAQNDRDIEELYGKKMCDLSFSSIINAGATDEVNEDSGTHDTESKQS